MLCQCQLRLHLCCKVSFQEKSAEISPEHCSSGRAERFRSARMHGMLQMCRLRHPHASQITCLHKRLLDASRSDKPQHASWACPKCRKAYQASEIPTEYRCFCGKQQDPPVDPWLAPHTCGDICGKELASGCGHTCVLLCHPGPCPPCPRQVDALLQPDY